MTNGIVNMMYVLQRLGVTALLAAVLSAASLSPLQAQEAAVNCDSGGQGLQKKIDSAAHGAEIFISGSCDDGPFFVSKDLKLIGVGPATLSAPNGSNNVVSARGTHVELRNLKINADGVQNGIALAQSSAVIQNVLVEGATNNAVLVEPGSTARIVGSEFRDNGRGITIAGTSHAGLFGNTIENNSITGINVDLHASANISNNTIINSRIGIRVDRFSAATAGGNTIEGNILQGVSVAPLYGVLTLFSPNTIQFNGTDVQCHARGILQVFQTQISATQTKNIDPACFVSKGAGVTFP